MAESQPGGGAAIIRPRVTIALVVNVISALSTRSLTGGNLCMADDGGLGSTGLGSADLRTVCLPGQLITWNAVALDVQTPVEISAITFLSPDGRELAAVASATSSSGTPSAPIDPPAGPSYPLELERSMTQGPQFERSVAQRPTGAAIWSGFLPFGLTPGTVYPYRIELRMSEGDFSVLQVDTPSLAIAGAC